MFGEVSGTLRGVADERPPIVLLHGLTFDRRQWAPLLRELDAADPGRRVLALDLPGHGESPGRSGYRLAPVTEVLHRAVTAAGLHEPVLVGHSVGGVIATAYAARFPAYAVVNLDQPLLTGGFGDLVRRAAPVLRGPGWRTVWDGLVAGMHLELLPPAARALAEDGSTPRPELLLGYWDELLTSTDDELTEQRVRDLDAIRERRVGYHFVASAEPPSGYRAWLRTMLPDLELTVLPGGHLPHLGYPAELAKILAGQTSHRPGPPGPAW